MRVEYLNEVDPKVDMVSTINEGLRMLQVLKERKNENMQRRNDNNIVLVERRQINTNYPAVAQLNIVLPVGNEQNNFKNYLNDKILKFPVDKDFITLTEITSQQFVLELRSTKIMYSWLDGIIHSLKKDFNEFNFEVKGCWDKY